MNSLVIPIVMAMSCDRVTDMSCMNLDRVGEHFFTILKWKMFFFFFNFCTMGL